MFAASKTASVSGGYQISRSLRFNSADSAYLSRTPASAGNRKTWTWSAWVKRSGISTATNAMFGGGTSTTDFAEVYFGADDTLRFYDFAGSTSVYSSSVYRDVSAWYHLVYAIDTTQATASNRVKMYVNGVQVTSFGTANYPTQNADLYINRANIHSLGALNYTGGIADYFNGYITEVNFIDGQALTPSSFGETNAQTGVWQPKAYSGSYGTNGFYLNFSDNSNTTAATLGKDYSGNGNNWTPNNFSVTAGLNNDSLVDSPTAYGVDTGVGGNVRGNYCTLNPLSTGTNCSPTPMVLTNGNLDFNYDRSSSGATWAIGTMSIPSTGKWYFEFNNTTGSSGFPLYGIAAAQQNRTNATVQNIRAYNVNTGNKYATDSSGTATVNTAYGATGTYTDIISVAVDCDAGTLVFYKNGTSQGTAFTDITSSGVEFSPCVFGGAANTAAGSANFGQRPFAYTAPSGYKALCTQNLPTPTIGATTATQAGKYYNAVLYTGNGSTPRAITGVGFQPDWVWTKARSIGYFNILYDSVRGTGTTKSLVSNNTDAEGASGVYANLTSFDSDGFTVGTTSSTNVLNASGETYVSWNWKANGSGSTNTAGSITSTVSANTTSGFSVVTYTGTGANATVGHGLGVAPSMVIVKRRNSAEDWQVRHISIAAVNSIELNLTGGASSSPTIWNSTNPTSTVFSIGTDTQVNASGGTYVAYCFAPIAGYSSMGSYVGNGSTDGPFIFTGMRPAFVLVRRSDGSDNWYIFDSKRIAYNVRNEPLYPNDSSAEGSGFNYIDLLSNGFKMRNNSYENISGANYIYAAFAENPFKYSLAR